MTVCLRKRHIVPGSSHRFGWVEEKIVVVPRIQASPKCGNNKIGLVTWRAAESKAFDAFCFNAGMLSNLFMLW